MSTLTERTTPRLREVLAYLESVGGTATYADIFQHIGEAYPPNADDLEILKTGAVRWVAALHWQTTGLTRAGWIVKDGSGSWSITDAGREALEKFPDPVALKAECDQIYRAWYEAKQALHRRAWLIRGSSVRGTNLVAEWLASGWVSIAASQLHEIEPGVSLEDLTAAAKSDYDHLMHQELKAKVDEIVAFVIKMAPGDSIVTTNDEQVFIGDVTGDWTWQKSPGGRSNLRRSVEWRNGDAPIEFAGLPAPLPAKLTSGGTIVDLTSELDAIDALTAPQANTEGGGESTESPTKAELSRPSPGLAAELYIEDESWLDGIWELLVERRQVIFYGPPGTGKTFMSRALANDLVGPEQVKLVQFHPSYTYEDFFEGYRPAAGDTGLIGFDLKPGPLRQLVTRANANRDLSFVLIIDEINRANLAKVFGELYFLLEYRDEAVDLLYSAGDAPFTLPPNIYIIGTMNTADRSIALIDSAMRRRFAFVNLDPREEPTHSLLARWSSDHGLPVLGAAVLENLNSRIDDPDFQIGPSYFMRSSDPDAFSIARLERVWSADILPLLEEHYFGQWPSYKKRFSLTSILAAVTVGAAPTPEAPGTEDAPAVPGEGAGPVGAEPMAE